MGWRETNATYGLRQLAWRLGMSPEQLLARPDIVAAAVGTLEGGQRGARHVAESFLDFVDRNGGGEKGVLAAIPHYDSMVMVNPRTIGNLAKQQNSSIAALNPEQMQPTMAHIQAVQARETPRLTPEGYTKNFSAPYPGIPGGGRNYRYYRTPDGQTIQAPTWAGQAITAGQFVRSPSGEYLVPEDNQQPFNVAWSRPQPRAINAPVPPDNQVAQGFSVDNMPPQQRVAAQTRAAFYPEQRMGAGAASRAADDIADKFAQPTESPPPRPPLEIDIRRPRPQPDYFADKDGHGEEMFYTPGQSRTPAPAPAPAPRQQEQAMPSRAPDFDARAFFDDQDRWGRAAGGEVDDHAGKVDKATAQYRGQPNGDRRCGSPCSMYRAPHCTAVKGMISPNGWCKYWHAEGRVAGGPVSSEELGDYLIRDQRMRRLNEELEKPGGMTNYPQAREQIDQDIWNGLGPQRGQRYFSNSPDHPDYNEPSGLAPRRQAGGRVRRKHFDDGGEAGVGTGESDAGVGDAGGSVADAAAAAGAAMGDSFGIGGDSDNGGSGSYGGYGTAAGMSDNSEENMGVGPDALMSPQEQETVSRAIGTQETLNSVNSQVAQMNSVAANAASIAQAMNLGLLNAPEDPEAPVYGAAYGSGKGKGTTGFSVTNDEQEDQGHMGRSSTVGPMMSSSVASIAAGPNAVNVGFSPEALAHSAMQVSMANQGPAMGAPQGVSVSATGPASANAAHSADMAANTNSITGSPAMDAMMGFAPVGSPYGTAASPYGSGVDVGPDQAAAAAQAAQAAIDASNAMDAEPGPNTIAVNENWGTPGPNENEAGPSSKGFGLGRDAEVPAPEAPSPSRSVSITAQPAPQNPTPEPNPTRAAPTEPIHTGPPAPNSVPGLVNQGITAAVHGLSGLGNPDPNQGMTYLGMTGGAAPGSSTSNPTEPTSPTPTTPTPGGSAATSGGGGGGLGFGILPEDEKKKRQANFVPAASYEKGGSVGEALSKAASSVDRNPTEKQKKAGNYAKGHLSFHGLSVAIENPEGGWRSGKDKGGKKWSVKMPAAYGYIKGSEGKDGDHVDVYLGRNHASDKVFVVDQVEAGSSKFDEHKCMLFYPSQAAALADYRRAFSDDKGNQRIGAVTQMSVAEFKSWLKSGDTKKPLGKIKKHRGDGGATISDDRPPINWEQDLGALENGLDEPETTQEQDELSGLKQLATRGFNWAWPFVRRAAGVPDITAGDRFPSPEQARSYEGMKDQLSEVIPQVSSAADPTGKIYNRRTYNANNPDSVNSKYEYRPRQGRTPADDILEREVERLRRLMEQGGK